MNSIRLLILGAALAASGSPPFASDQPPSPGDAQGQPSAAPSEGGAAGKESPPKAAPEPPPLPFHSIEGYGGGAITPMAYLVNPSTDPKKIFGLPSAAITYGHLGSKELVALTATETFFGRVELGYGVDQLHIGTLPDEIAAATGVAVEKDHVWLHNFNLRGLILPENSFDAPLPAFTLGAHYKYNEGVEQIDKRTGRALSAIGYSSDNAPEFTATLTKMFPKLVFGRPFIVSAGLRASQGAQIGFLGFSNEWDITFEGNAVYMPLDWLVLGYEFRQKNDPYKKLGRLVGDEDDWHAFEGGFVIGSHATLVAGYGLFGRLANTWADDAWVVQTKIEF
jgi:hypothetical protein